MNRFDWQVYRRQVVREPTRNQTAQSKKEFHSPDRNELPSTRTKTYLLTMLPVAQGDHVFNSGGEQEWEIQRNTDVKFAIYGTKRKLFLLV